MFHKTYRTLLFAVVDEQHIYAGGKTADIQLCDIVVYGLFQQYFSVGIADGDDVLACRLKLQHQFNLMGVALYFLVGQ